MGSLWSSKDPESYQGLSTATANRSLACLRRMFQIGPEDSKIQHAPKIRLLKEPPARKGFFSIGTFKSCYVLCQPTCSR